MLLWPHKQALNATIGDSVISCLEPLYQKGFTFFWHGLENRNGACLLMTHYLGVIGNIKPLLKAWTLPLMTVRGYEDVTSSGLEFSLAPRVTSVGCGHNTDGEHSVKLHQTLYESINNMFASKTSPAFASDSGFMSRALLYCLLKSSCNAVLMHPRMWKCISMEIDRV